MRRLFAALALVFALVSAAWGQEEEAGPTRHMSFESEAGRADYPDIAPLPGYATREIGKFVFYYRPSTESLVDPLFERAERVLKELVDTIGIDPPGPYRVFVAASKAEFAALQPGGRKLPGWVAGIAYGQLMAMVLRFSGESGQPIDLVGTFDHELSHLVLRGALGEADAPTWFVEGLAQWQAREFDLDRLQRIWRAMIAGRLLSLEDLIDRFPRDPSDVSLAYDESFEFVNFLVGEHGRKKFHELIQRLGRGEAFAAALEGVYAVPLEELEAAWMKSLKLSYGWIPLLSSGAFIWTIASLLFLWGYAKRRREKATKMAEWDAEERAREIEHPFLPSRPRPGENGGDGSGKNSSGEGAPPTLH
ncbi:MAG: hypothetical protein C4523_19840 [Myxococcales bacterium]|nr:MAG: hypothetical protein C4523_19840 [Myxococcales bacterium]